MPLGNSNSYRARGIAQVAAFLQATTPRFSDLGVNLRVHLADLVLPQLWNLIAPLVDSRAA